MEESTESQTPTDEPARSNRTTRLSHLETFDWPAFCCCFTLLISSALLIANGTCSQPRGLTAERSVCYGGHLSIQAWLAITGLEFSVLGTYLLPRLVLLAVSKYFTSRLERRGVRFADLLNSLSSAPFWTRLRYGMKRVFALHMLVALSAALVSVLYKFSFVRVNQQRTIGIPNIFDGFMYAPVGSTDHPGTDFGQRLNFDASVWSNNLVDLLTANNASARYFGPSRYFYQPADLILGPTLNSSAVSGRVLNGSVESCQALQYVRNTVTYQGIDYGFGWNGSVYVYNTSHGQAPVPTVHGVPYNNGVRVINDISRELMDITASEDRDMELYIGGLPGNDTPWGHFGEYIYDSFINVTFRYCVGYVSWRSNVTNQEYGIQDPHDLICNHKQFDPLAWNSSSAGMLSQKLIDTTIAIWSASSPMNISTVFRYVAVPIISALEVSAPYSNSSSLFPNTGGHPDNPRCGNLPGKLFAIADGLITNQGTGMTSMGIALQSAVLLTAALGLLLLLLPTLPLLTEWPAQWLHLAETLEPGTVSRAVDGACAGTDQVGSDIQLFLASVSKDMPDSPPQLGFVQSKGTIRKGELHS